MCSYDDPSSNTEAYYESVASQEEIYLEQTEEDLRAILIFTAPSPSGSGVVTSYAAVEERPVSNDHDQMLTVAAEGLITGDSDDPPLSECDLLEMLKLL